MPKVKLGHRLIGIAVELYRNDLLEKRSDNRTAHPETPSMRIRLRRVSYRDPQTHRYRVSLTNRFDLPALAIADTIATAGRSNIRKYPDSDQK